ncbi:MAG: Imm57 family immunity protein [Pseudoxanthomonas sp.]
MKNALCLSILLCSGLSAIGDAQESRRSLDRRNIANAGQGIALASLLSQSRETRYRCATAPYACLQMDGVEAGLAVLFAGRTDDYKRGLLAASRFALDGEGSEQFHDYVFMLSRDDRRRLGASLEPARLRAQCEREVLQVKRRVHVALSSTSEQVCRSVESVRHELKRVMAVD